MNEWKMQREDVEKLISAYKKLRCLWDFRSNEYKRYDLKKYSWQKLGNMFGKEPNDVKLKIKHLRSAYVSEKRKVDASYGTSRIYRPNLYYYKDLNFLDSIIVCRKGPKLENFDQSMDLDEYNEQPSETSFSEPYVADADVVSPPSPSPSPTTTSQVQRTSESHLKMQNPKHRLAPYYSKLDAAINNFEEVTKTTSTEPIYMAFAKTVALQLSQLPPLDATATMSEIHQILSKNIIKSMLSKNKQSTSRTNRETTVGNIDRKFSVLSEVVENRLDEENNHKPNEFEEVSM